VLFPATGSRPWRRLELFAVLGCLSAAPSRAGAETPGAVCERKLVAQSLLRGDDGFITVPAMINGQPASMLLDTGSDAGLFTINGARRLGLSTDPGRRTKVEGTGGAGHVVPNVRFASLVVGGLPLGGGSLPVGTLPAEPVLQPPVAGLLGADALGTFDLDLDLPHRRLGIWSVRLGSVACAPPPAWAATPGGWDTIPLQRHGQRFTLTVQLDGQPLTALLDTGARSRILSVAAARRLGVGPDVIGADPGGITAGVDLHETDYHWHRFRSLRIGSETEAQPVLTVAPLAEHVDLLLGADWFAAHEVWLSNATNEMFVRRPAPGRHPR
jgi:predicted aspartyl protease